MALHLSGVLKDQKRSLGAHFWSTSRFCERRGGEMREKARVWKRSSFGWVWFPFLPPKRSSNMEGEI